MIHPQRIKSLNSLSPDQQGKFVLYWMQASQRTHYNHALEFAANQANRMNLPLLVLFCIMPDFPDANARHFNFMLEGLQEVKDRLSERNIHFSVRIADPVNEVLRVSKGAALVVCDVGYLRFQRQWRSTVAEKCLVQVIQIESNVIVPVGQVSNKQEYAARTIRPKILKQLSFFNDHLPEIEVKVIYQEIEKGQSVSISNIPGIIDQIKADRSVSPVSCFCGGHSKAKSLLDIFFDEKLDDYATFKNHPELDYESNLSPFLHFGQISPLEIYLRVKDIESNSVETFLEELIVRRELSINFVTYCLNYDSFAAIPDWASQTLYDHRNDKREYLYTKQELEDANTHDHYWNASQKQLLITGKMHGYMRMYWAKKIIEWTQTPEDAFATAIYLNDKYELDGRDANGYTGVSWCFGTHDRPWKERAVFGKVRYMNDKGLERKFDIKAYVEKIDRLDSGS